MAEEIRIGLGVTGADKTAFDLKKVGAAADSTGDDLKEMAADAKILDKAVDDLNEQLTKTRLELAKDPGDKTLWKQLRGQEREVNKLTRLRKAVFGSDAELTDVGRQVGKTVSGGIGDALGALPSQLKGIGIVAGVAIGAALTPMIGAAIGAAVLGGVGIGGIAGGIAAAAQDSRVKAAGEHLGDSLMKSFGVIGRPFVEPLIQQMGRLETIGASFFAELGDDIAPLADNLDNLVDGIKGFAENLDFSAAVRAAKPLLDVLGEKLPDIGDAITGFFEQIAEESDGTAIALGDILDITGELILELGAFVGWLSSVYETMSSVGDSVGDAIDQFKEFGGQLEIPVLATFVELMDAATFNTHEMTGAIRMAGNESQGFADGIGNVGESAEDAAKELLDFSEAIDEAFGKQMNLDEATARYKRGIRELTEDLKEGKRSLDENTEAGQDNADNVRDWLQNIEDVRKATIAQGGDVRAANKTYEDQVAALKNVLIQLGYSKKAVDDLVGAYKKLPTRIEIELILKASTLPSKQALEHAMEGRASGGPTKGGRTYMVGENGPELWAEGSDGHMYNATQTAAMMSGASGGSYAAAPAAVTVTFNFQGADEEFLRFMRKTVEVTGGGDVQVALGS